MSFDQQSHQRRRSSKISMVPSPNPGHKAPPEKRISMKGLYVFNKDDQVNSSYGIYEIPSTIPNTLDEKSKKYKLKKGMTKQTEESPQRIKNTEQSITGDKTLITNVNEKKLPKLTNSSRKNTETDSPNKQLTKGKSGLLGLKKTLMNKQNSLSMMTKSSLAIQNNNKNAFLINKSKGA